METNVPGAPSCGLEDVLFTHELNERPARKNFAAENRALLALAEELEKSPRCIQMKLADVVLDLCEAHSAGISLLEPGSPDVFRWTAIVGEAVEHLDGVIPRHESPCGVVVDRNEVLLFRHAERHFTRLQGAEPAMYESLLAPFTVNGRAAGTVWAVKHRPVGHQFNAEDARVLKVVSHFASAAYESASSRTQAERSWDTTASLHPRLLHVSKMATIGEISSGMANELSQPLTAIANYAEVCKRLLTRSQAEPEKLSSAMDAILTQVQRATGTIEGLRALSASVPAPAAETNLSEAVAEVLEILKIEARARHVVVTLRLEPELPSTRVARIEIQHVVLSLVRNAFAALMCNLESQREVILETRSAPDGVELVVRDNGPGLPPEVLKRMLTPFLPSPVSGTGLGLPTSHSIVRAHGGQLRYEPNSPAGACFRISLPSSRWWDHSLFEVTG